MRIRWLAPLMTMACAHAALVDDSTPSVTDAAWQAYEHSVEQALSTSSAPRDWALASSMPMIGNLAMDTAPGGRSELLRRAATNAPDDALVQWMVASDGRLAETPGGRIDHDEAIRALLRLEPDNAAAWLVTLPWKPAPGDDAFIDDALAHMASSTRYNDHFADTLHAWMGVYDRWPAPSPIATRADEVAPDYGNSFVRAMAVTAATAMPAYQTLTRACKPAAGESLALQRSVSCTAAGRLMLERGQTLIDRLIGFGVLRNVGELTDADRQLRRNLDWVIEKGTRVVEHDRTEASAFENDWRNLDDEMTIYQRALRRAGQPEKAPDDWVDPRLPEMPR